MLSLGLTLCATSIDTIDDLDSSPRRQQFSCLKRQKFYRLSSQTPFAGRKRLSSHFTWLLRTIRIAMGRLIKNHWARLIILTAAAYQVGSAIEGFIWPKVFWDFMTKNLNGAVKPIPVLQILNLLMGLLGLAWEWPLKYFAGTLPHRSIEFRLILYPLSALLSMLLYQGTDPAIYYLVGIGVYFWAYSEGEVVCPVPWTLPKRNSLKV